RQPRGHVYQRACHGPAPSNGFGRDTTYASALSRRVPGGVGGQQVDAHVARTIAGEVGVADAHRDRPSAVDAFEGVLVATGREHLDRWCVVVLGRDTARRRPTPLG